MSTIIVNKIMTAVLKLNGLAAAKVIKIVNAIVTKMTGNVNFTTPNPTLPSITTQVGVVSTALSNATNKPTRAVLAVQLRLLMLMMTTLRAYVQTVANVNAETAEAVVLSSGMDVKKITPRQKRIFNVVNTLISGTVKAGCPKVKGGRAYAFQYTSTPEDPKSMISAGILPAAECTVEDLVSGTEYTFYYASITKTGQSDWSDGISIVVM